MAIKYIFNPFTGKMDAIDIQTETDPLSLHLDQTTPQTVIGTPEFPDLKLTDNVLDSPTCSTLGDFIDIISAGYISGGLITDGGSGTVNVATGCGFVKIADNPNATTKFFNWDAVTGLSLTDDYLNYVYVNYNIATEAITVSATTSFSSLNRHTQFVLGMVYRRGNILEIINDSGVNLVDFRINEWTRLEHRPIERMSGGNVAESGVRYLTVTSAIYYKNYSKLVISAIDTTGADRFTSIYRDGVGGWTFDDNTGAGWQQFSNILYDDDSGTPADINTAKYATYYVYQCLEGDIYIQMGQSGINNLSQAQAEEIPIPPNYLAQWAKLRAKIVIAKDAVNAYELLNYNGEALNYASVSIHNELTGLQGGTAEEYYHITSAQNTIVGNTSGINTGDQDLSGYVPYTGATTDVDLGDKNLTTTGSINGSRGTIKGTFTNADLGTTVVSNEGNNSYDTTHVLAGNHWIMAVSGVWTNSEHTGTNYYNGGSFNGSTGVITLGTALSQAVTFVYIAYTYCNGTLTITHNWNLSTPYTVLVSIADDSGDIVSLPAVGLANSVTADLGMAIGMTGNWGYLIGG